MEQTPNNIPARKRRFARTWAILGVAGLATGAAYSSGFAVTTNSAPTDAATGAATPVFGEEGVALQSLYSGRSTTVGTLNMSFDGVYAVIADTPFFQIDLTGTDPYGDPYDDTYYAEVFVRNWNDLAPPAGTPQWSQLNFKFLLSAPVNGACTDPTVFDASLDTEQLAVDRVDARVMFPLAGNADYCIGLHQENALSQAERDIVNGVVDGTFITRPDPDTIPTDAPQFMVVLNRAS